MEKKQQQKRRNKTTGKEKSTLGAGKKQNIVVKGIFVELHRGLPHLHEGKQERKKKRSFQTKVVSRRSWNRNRSTKTTWAT